MPLVDALQQAVEVRQRAEHRIDVVVVGDVVAVVCLRGGVDRREPQDVHAQALQVVELGAHALKVAEAAPLESLKERR